MEPSIYIQEEFVALCIERVVLEGPTGVVDQEFALVETRFFSYILLLNNTQLSQLSTTKYLLSCCKLIYICHCHY